MENKRRTKTPPFIMKLAQILQEPSFSELITWTQDDKSFLVHQIDKFSVDILPQFYRHSNYSSFLRQLNLYGFIKMRYHDDRKHLFTHPLFIRDQQYRHCQIKRRPVIKEQTPKEQESQIKQPLNVRVRNMKKKQDRLMRQCADVIRQNDDILEENFILKATMEDDSISNKHILDSISNFIIHHSHQGTPNRPGYALDYCDSSTISNLLAFLDGKHCQPSLSNRTLTDFFNFVQNHDLPVVMRALNSLKPHTERKIKHSYTIVEQPKESLPAATAPRALEYTE